MIDNILTAANKAMIASYARSVLGAALATYTATSDWTMALNSLWAALIPVAIRFLNGNDNAFGRSASAE